MDFCDPDSHLVKISDMESPLNFQVKGKPIIEISQKQRNYALVKNAKIVMFKIGIDYRVASLFTRYLTAIGIIPESFNL